VLAAHSTRRGGAERGGGGGGLLIAAMSYALCAMPHKYHSRRNKMAIQKTDKTQQVASPLPRPRSAEHIAGASGY
jgi:hypothetical protein